MLVLGGLLVRSDIHRAAVLNPGAIYPRSRTLEDLRPVRDLLVDYVAASIPSSQLLDFLGDRRQPASIFGLCANLPFRPEKLWTALLITSVAGLIRFGRGGITLTDAGKAVRAELADAAVAGTEAVVPIDLHRPDDAVDNAAPVAASSELDPARRSHLQFVRDALRGAETAALPDRTLDRARLEMGQLRKPATVAGDSLESAKTPATSDAAPRAYMSEAD